MGPARPPIQVTIDCKTTEAGVLQRLMVQIGAVVKPGQAVASISAAGAAAHAPPVPAAAATAAPSLQSAGGSDSHGGRMPGIHFPTRRTAGGERISDLPEDKQGQIQGVSHAAHTPPPAGPAAGKPAAVAVSPPPAAPQKAKVSTTVLTEVPARRQLTAREVELINSGGA